MKSREDFINSVWEKSEKVRAEERAKQQKRRRAGGLTAAAACLALVIGITSAGGPAELMEDLRGGTSTDEISIAEDAEVLKSYNALPGSDDTAAATARNTAAEDEAGCGAPADSADDMAYIRLPIGVEIACFAGDCCEVINGSSEKEITEYMQWFYSLPEDQVLTTEAFESLKEIPTGYYKFTMDFSPDGDTEGADQIFYIIGEVALP